MHVSVCACVHMCACMHVYMCVCMCMCVFVYAFYQSLKQVTSKIIQVEALFKRPDVNCIATSWIHGYSPKWLSPAIWKLSVVTWVPSSIDSSNSCKNFISVSPLSSLHSFCHFHCTRFKSRQRVPLYTGPVEAKLNWSGRVRDCVRKHTAAGKGPLGACPQGKCFKFDA